MNLNPTNLTKLQLTGVMTTFACNPCKNNKLGLVMMYKTPDAIICPQCNYTRELKNARPTR